MILLTFILNLRRGINQVLVLLGLILLSACSPGKQPFLMVQTCLVDEKGLGEFLVAMRAIAQDNGMEYFDRSAETQRELQFMHESNVNVAVSPHTINIGMMLRDGMGVSAGDLGSSDYQVVIGFAEGSDPAKAREFSSRVIQKLSKRWPLETVPEGKGAFPLKNCGN